MDLHVLAIAFGVYVLAGTIKGIAGIGLPTVAISLLSQFFDPRLAISLALVPIIATNAWQVYRAGRFLETLRRFAPFLVCLVLFVYVSAQFAHGISVRALVLFMGSMVILFTLVNLLFKPPALPDEWDTPAQVVTGTAAGFMGGITAIWSPPVMVFLLARRTPKDAFVRASGVIIAVGGVPLIISYWQAGLFGGETAIVSCLMVMPAVVGFFVGERLRSRLDAKRFHTVVLIIFLFLGLNLIRRGLSL